MCLSRGMLSASDKITGTSDCLLCNVDCLFARISRVLKEVRGTLTDLKLAIEGTIVMSQGLRKSLDSMYDARIPDRWLKISWESATLGFWYTELLERDYQFRQWCNNGRPRVFWMTGFFNPQGFLTAMRQVR